MKALSIKQPWASLIVAGHKHYETRGWNTNYRGPLVICSSKAFELALQEMAICHPFIEHLPTDATRPGELDLPLGMALCLCELVAVHTAEHLVTTGGNKADWQLERQFGDYTNGRFAFELANVRALKQPVPIRGALNIFEIPDQLIKDFLP